MDEKLQQEFIGWLKGKLEIEDDAQLEEAINALGEDGIANAFEMFNKERERANVVAAAKGAKLQHIKNLQKYRK